MKFHTSLGESYSHSPLVDKKYLWTGKKAHTVHWLIQKVKKNWNIVAYTQSKLVLNFCCNCDAKLFKKKKKKKKPCRPIKYLQQGLQEICALLFTVTINLIFDHFWMSFWWFLNVNLVVRNVPFFLALHIPSCIYYNWTIDNPVIKCHEGTEGFLFYYQSQLQMHVKILHLTNGVVQQQNQIVWKDLNKTGSQCW